MVCLVFIGDCIVGHRYFGVTFLCLRPSHGESALGVPWDVLNGEMLVSGVWLCLVWAAIFL
ncbi:hypothetical protein XF_1014 [Xylella fastidiosa 9a5c]|uniref:Uncharacterized protein n=1 Tax=Xylella fastidiosa (strain 9a5c) TaxID=160492 RepID=Q9PEL4_XYLFA|nr:hypothetical protein XF_1014 [Xylella fastidiosa 9a5c]